MFHNQIQTLNQNYRLVGRSSTDDIENRIYIRREFTRKKGNLQEKSVKRPFSCTVSKLQVSFTYLCYTTFWALEHHFIENLKLILKENQIMK